MHFAYVYARARDENNIDGRWLAQVAVGVFCKVCIVCHATPDRMPTRGRCVLSETCNIFPGSLCTQAAVRASVRQDKWMRLFWQIAGHYGIEIKCGGGAVLGCFRTNSKRMPRTNGRTVAADCEGFLFTYQLLLLRCVRAFITGIKWNFGIYITSAPNSESMPLPAVCTPVFKAIFRTRHMWCFCVVPAVVVVLKRYTQKQSL